jgi:hypothetical protein
MKTAVGGTRPSTQRYLFLSRHCSGGSVCPDCEFTCVDTVYLLDSDRLDNCESVHPEIDSTTLFVQVIDKS